MAKFSDKFHKYSEYIGIYVSKETKEVLEDASAETEISVSQYLRQLIWDHFGLSRVISIELTSEEVEELAAVGIEVSK